MSKQELSPGVRVGPFEILSLIGRGGMGQVWRARDTRLGRDVAIKTSSEHFSERFEREARAIAALNHPNICTLHDIGSSPEVPGYLVMELVDGETLAARLKQGAVPFDESIAIARQISAALEAAHEKGIVHRDLKPGNVILKPDGSVKVLDFGLAKVGGGRVAPASNPEDSPTLTMGATQAGVILGTAAYMSPEQARGKPVDKRADIWAFGVVLYEMLTGKRPFAGDDLTETLASVVKDKPDLSILPFEGRRLVAGCLEKDPAKRLRDIADAWQLIDGAPPAPVVIEKASQSRFLPWVIGSGVLALGLATLAFVHFRETPPETPLFRFDQPAPSQTTYGADYALSPDGRTLAFGARGEDGQHRIWLRDLGSQETRVLKGTEGVGNPIFWSPDGRSIAFSGAPPLAKLMRIDIAGGAPQTLCPAPAGAPVGTWNAGVILYRAENGLGMVPESGGECTIIAVLDTKAGEIRATSPSMLPDGRHFLYFRAFQQPEKNGVYLGSLDAKPGEQGSQRILAVNAPARYVPSPGGGSLGYLAFVRDNTLLLQEFDPDRVTLRGEPVPLFDDVRVPGRDLPSIRFSRSGMLAYRSEASERARELIWYEAAGTRARGSGEPGLYQALSLSPDGKHLAYQTADLSSRNLDLWIKDLGTASATRFTFDQRREGYPVWTRDGSRLIYSAERESSFPDFYWKAANGTGDEELLLKSGVTKYPMDLSPDGKFLLFIAESQPTAYDLWVLPMEPRGEPRPLLRTPVSETHARFSPDGKYIVYAANETGSAEIYVRSFSVDGTLGSAQIVSRGGGTQPRWRRDGKQILYIRGDNHMIGVPVSTSPVFTQGTPNDLFATSIWNGLGYPNTHRWDIAPDGRFLINSVPPGAEDSPIHVILNWQELLKKR